MRSCPLQSESYQEPLLVEGRNCWRKREADRIAFLVDGESYFSAFAKAVENAERSIYIAGWDIDSRLTLRRDSEESKEASKLIDLLNRAARKNPKLHIYILVWDFSMVFMLDRETFPLFRFGWNAHRRIHFVMDAEHPIGGSHHQKIVAMDDSIAFAGGLDLSRSRWDTSEHLMGDSRRVDDDGVKYLPFHDVHMAVDWQAAESLADLFRIRWELATGKKLPPIGATRGYAWPIDAAPDITSTDVAIARTLPAFNGTEQMQEILTLYKDAIACAQNHIYIENQYITAHAVGDAIAERLREDYGPEIIIVAPHKSSGWLEESIMDSRRAVVVKKLWQADAHNRLGIYYPVVPGLEHGDMMVHSKVLIVDDNIVRIGSSNLSNRSMGYDTECDLAVESAGEDRIRKDITGFRARLLSEHLGITPDEFRSKFAKGKSIKRIIESLQNKTRTLRPLKIDIPEWLENLSPTFSIIDPEQTIDPSKFIDNLAQDEATGSDSRRYIKIGAVLLILLGLGAAWKWGPLGDWITLETLTQIASHLKQSPLAPAYVLGGYVLGGLVMFPLTLLIVTTAIVFGPFWTIIYGFSGTLLSASINYNIGRKLGRQTLRKIAGGKLNKISKWLAKDGIVSVASIRLIPIAPFQIVNLIMGASHIKYRDFVIGTAIGLIPGIFGIALFADSALSAVQNPSWRNIGLSVAVFAGLIGLSYGINRYFGRKSKESEGEHEARSRA